MNESEDGIKPFEFLQNIGRAIEADAVNANMTLLLVHYMTHQFDDWIFNDKTVAKKVHLCSKVVAREKNRLEKLGIVSLETAYEKLGDHTSGRKGTYIKVNYFWRLENGSNEITSNIIHSNKVPSNQIHSNEVPSNEITMKSVPTLIKNIGEQGINESKECLEQGREESKEEVEQVGGQAAPASESATEGSHSTGEPDLLGKIAPLPEKQEKPKGKREGKAAGNAKQKFNPPTHDQVAARVKNRVDNKGFSAKWTLYQINETATRIIAHYTMTGWTYGKNQTPMKSWEGAVDGWLSRSNYLPEMPDISTTDALQQPQRQQLAGQTMNEAEVMAILTRRNTSQKTFDAESNRISQYLENFQK